MNQRTADWLEEETFEEQLEKFVAGLVDDPLADAALKAQLFAYVRGERGAPPAWEAKRGERAYSAFSALRRMGERERGDSYYRALHLLMKRDSELAGVAVVDPWYKLLRPIGWLEERDDLNERLREAERALGLTAGAVGWPAIIANVRKQLTAHGLAAYGEVRRALTGMLLVRAAAGLNPDTLVLVRDTMHPLLWACVAEREGEVEREARRVSEQLASAAAASFPNRERGASWPPANSADDLEPEQWQAAWKAVRGTTAGAESRPKAPEPVLGAGRAGEAVFVMKEGVYLLAAACLYRLQLPDGRNRLLFGGGALERALRTETARTGGWLPLEMHEALLALDPGSNEYDEFEEREASDESTASVEMEARLKPHEAQEPKALEELEALLPDARLYGLIATLLWEYGNLSYGSYERIGRLALARPSRTLEAMRRISRPALKAYLYWLLKRHGLCGGEERDVVEDIALGAFRPYPKALAYLEGRLSLAALEAGAAMPFGSTFTDETGGALWLEASHALACLETGHPVKRRLLALLTHGTDERIRREWVAKLCLCPAFCPQEAIEAYADHPEVRADVLLTDCLQLAGLAGQPYAALCREMAERCALRALPLFSQLPAAARLLVLDAALRQLRLREGSSDQWRDAISLGLQDGSKQVQELTLRHVEAYGDRRLWMDLYRTGKKKQTRLAALDALRQDELAAEALSELLEGETNRALRQTLSELLSAVSAAGAGAEQTVPGSLRGRQRLEAVKWLAAALLPDLLDEAGRPLQAEWKSGALAAAIESEPELAALGKRLAPDARAEFVLAALRLWEQQDCPAKERWLLHLGAAWGDLRTAEWIGERMREWIKAARKEMAVEGVRALSAIGTIEALRTLDHLRLLASKPQLKEAIETALNEAAAGRDWTRDELDDRLVPDFGFDNSGRRLLSYGPRSFLLRVSSDGELRLARAEDDKELRQLPKPGAKDDAALAEQTRQEWSRIRKGVSALRERQTARLEQALLSRRMWTSEGWKQLFIGNVLMRDFAVRLIWGEYGDDGLKQSFRYMGDGTFNTSSDEEWRVADGVRIGLAHPLELSGTEREAWQAQLEDYEVAQPFPQLDASWFEVSMNGPNDD